MVKGGELVEQAERKENEDLEAEAGAQRMTEGELSEEEMSDKRFHKHQHGKEIEHKSKPYEGKSRRKYQAQVKQLPRRG